MNLRQNKDKTLNLDLRSLVLEYRGMFVVVVVVVVVVAAATAAAAAVVVDNQ